MKTLLLIAFIGLSVCGYAQNKDQKNWTQKVVTHKQSGTIQNNQIVSYGAMPEKGDEANLPDYVTVLPHVPNNYVAVPPAPEACRVYRQHNIVVKECPGTFYDNNSVMQYNGEGTWLGYYPESKDDGDMKANNLVAPQHTTINNYRGVAPADGTFCADCDAW